MALFKPDAKRACWQSPSDASAAERSESSRSASPVQRRVIEEAKATYERVEYTIASLLLLDQMYLVSD